MRGLPIKKLVFVVTCLAVFPVAGNAVAATVARSWAQPQIKLVTKLGLFAGTAATFRPQDPLTASTLAQAVAELTGAPAKTVADPAAPVSMESLDATLVRALGLGDTAYRFYLSAQQSGLHPPARFGTEAVARLLGLRLNHPVGQDDLELQPQQTATRAEAAYSVAQILSFGASSGFDQGSESSGAATSVNDGPQWDNSSDSSRHFSAATALTDFAATWQVEGVKSAAESFTLPALTDWQTRILGAAVSYIGYPYIWGGTDQGTPGFDCSGFVWGVYKLTSYTGEGTLADVLRGRTTMEMSGEVPKSNRIGFKSLEPGDVLFFGAGRHSKPAQIDHTGIYLGNGWFVHSSGFGVAVASLDGWYRSSFAWARRPLAEAGLA
jgi:cell wall-associated NlpC family hydrolase